MSRVTKALVIREPWIDFILSGQKTWEMRSTRTMFRGWFGLIPKGSGAIVGVARLIDVGRALSPDEMVATFDMHRIPEQIIRSGAVAKWNTPWVLADVRALTRPVPYRHRSGAVTWVELDPEAVAGIMGELASALGAQAALEPPRATLAVRRVPAATSPEEVVTPARPHRAPGLSGIWGEVVLTDGNLRNGHFYMRSFIHRFPPDLVGGSNRASAAPRIALLDWGRPAPIETDIDGEKQFFRARGWVKAFIAENGAEPGDRVRVEETAPYRYRVTLLKQTPPDDLEDAGEPLRSS